MGRAYLDNQWQARISRTAKETPGVALINPHARESQRYIALIVVVTPFLGFLIALGLVSGHQGGFVAAGLFVVMYVTTLLGIEVGFHRHFAHRAFRANPFVRVALGIFGSMAAQGPLIFWVAIHRRHHAYSDQPGDPHSPNMHGPGLFGILRGIWHAHIGWLFDFEMTDWVHYAPDLLRERVMFRVHRMYPLWIVLGLVLPAILGGLLTLTWSGAFYGFLWGGLARVFLVHHSVWSVNSLCHFFGKRPFQGNDHSTNNFWLTFISLGGSWHNNHHTFPRSAKNGLTWWQLDPSAWFIQALKTAGLAWDVKAPTLEMIEKAKIKP
jgi:stearoyl-CoA desaturase (delta-9 desaturase)